ncbi:MAG: type I methionyl aminopeptidase [Actinobacteria bacterium]|nr:type I methionyl aminopeptidase [Actinomycetota bacterium]
MIICKSGSEIKLMREAGRIVAEVFLGIEEFLKPGVDTGYIDKKVEHIIRQHGAIPAFKGYIGRLSSRPFPASSCISINEEVVHGIPGRRIISEGDLVAVDVGVKLNGFYGDAARSYRIGKVSGIADRLWKATKEALELGIEKCLIGGRLSDISNSIESRALLDGFSVVKDFVGHGIGKKMHEDPQILNYGPPGQGPVLKKGMVLAIEPMLNEGGSEVQVKEDLWTVITMDRKLSCHFENTVAITENGPEVLTAI